MFHIVRNLGNFDRWTLPNIFWGHDFKLFHIYALSIFLQYKKLLLVQNNIERRSKIKISKTWQILVDKKMRMSELIKPCYSFAERDSTLSLCTKKYQEVILNQPISGGSFPSEPVEKWTDLEKITLESVCVCVCWGGGGGVEKPNKPGGGVI